MPSAKKSEAKQSQAGKSPDGDGLRLTIRHIMGKHLFKIADWQVAVSFADEGGANGMHLLPSYQPFRIGEDEALPQLLSMEVDDSLRPVRKSERTRIRVFDTGNGDTVVDRLSDGGYQYIIRDIFSADCALLICDATFSRCRCALNGTAVMRRFGLNNALMLAYAFASARHDTLLIHASLVRHRGKAYAFTAKSGTGKSTQVANWLRMIPGCDLMNDDNPIVRVFPGKRAVIYGSPWSGKTPCYRQTSAPLAAVTQIDRAAANSVERLPPLQAFGFLLASCSAMKWEKTLFSNICDTVTAVVETVPIYVLHCTADPLSAVVCHNVIAAEKASHPNPQPYEATEPEAQTETPSKT